MLEICLAAAIRHGNFPGTKIPYLWTIDLLLMLPWIADPRKRTTLVSIKPLESERYLRIDPLDRGAEKLEAERRFAADIHATYLIGDASLYPEKIFAQLESIVGCANLPAAHHLTRILKDFLDADGPEKAQQESLTETHARLRQDWNLPLHHATFLLDHMLWHQHIDCDLSRHLHRNRPPRPGGRRLRRGLRDMLGGGTP
ncbi:hypothetical protein VVD49_16375 [Uliginosibacterium sp. H3]|uniref:Uncharacterized protein n=1 Tax=Uliginosibacterium silvisoli TaxID=3114758 RepID=A0ABU6K725_9RHOO|nr:hypothetical protein [Uliginosibacterium sp. H3]